MPVGALVAIQPALCVFLVPLITALAAHHPPLPMVAAGAAVSVAALLWLVADTAIWAVVLFMVTLAVGAPLPPLRPTVSPVIHTRLQARCSPPGAHSAPQASRCGLRGSSSTPPW